MSPMMMELATKVDRSTVRDRLWSGLDRVRCPPEDAMRMISTISRSLTDPVSVASSSSKATGRVEIPDQPGSGTAQASVFYKDCACSDCAESVLTTAAHVFKATVEVEVVEALNSHAADAARSAH